MEELKLRKVKDGTEGAAYMAPRIVIGAGEFRCNMGRRLEVKLSLICWRFASDHGWSLTLLSSEVMEVYLGHEYAPRGYAWMVPSSNGTRSA